jgi:trehalose/maltose hydrolase-like predicted phosphorylase
MKKLFIALVLLLFIFRSRSQDPWILKTDSVNPAQYYGETVANGMVGIVSSADPLKIKDVVLAGAYDLYGRGRVSNFLKSFNLLNMRLEIDGAAIASNNVSGMKQQLDMRYASFTTTFEHTDKATISYTYYALRQLPYTVLMDVSITAKKDITISSASVMEAPDALKDVQNYYNEIDSPM